MVLILRGFAQGVPTAQLARELGRDRPELLRLRHRLQGLAFDNRDRMPLDDRVLEADEAYQNAGKKASRSPTRRIRRAVGATTRQEFASCPETSAQSPLAWDDRHDSPDGSLIIGPQSR